MIDAIKVLFMLTGASTYLVTKNQSSGDIANYINSSFILCHQMNKSANLLPIPASTESDNQLFHNVITNISAINKADATKMPSNTNSAHYWFQSIKNETYQNADCPPLVSKQTSSTWPTKDINFHNQLERAAKHADYYKEAINEKEKSPDAQLAVIKTTPTVQSGQQQPAPPVYEVLINEEEKDLPKKLFQVKAVMMNGSQQQKRNQSLMFILSGNGVDYEHPEKSKFAINAFTGELFLILPLDRDPPNGQELYQLIINAEDENSVKLNGSVLVLVRVRDINDNAPYFEKNQYLAHVSENSAAGVDVIRVQAIDRDPDSIVRYSIEVNRLNSDSELIFDIDELSGLISTAVCCLDRESIDQYTIKICAADWSNSGHQNFVKLRETSLMDSNNSCTNVIINVTDENDEPPKFFRDKFYLNLPEGVNELYSQRTLLNTSVLDNDLPETNHFVCRVDVRLKFSISVANIGLLNSSESIDSLFLLFAANETARTNVNSNQTFFVHSLPSMAKYFQCQINRYGNIRIFVSNIFSAKIFHQVLMQEFQHFRSGLWNRFRQTFGKKLNSLFDYNSKVNLLFPLPNYVELLMKILVSDMGFFEIPSFKQLAKLSPTSSYFYSSASSVAPAAKQHYDLSSLLDTHIINAELNLKLSIDPFTAHRSLQTTVGDNPNESTQTDIIIHKQRISQDGDNANENDELNKLKQSKKVLKQSGIGFSLKNNLDIEKTFGTKNFIQSIVGKIFAIQLNSQWFWIIFLGFASVFFLALFLFISYGRKIKNHLINSEINCETYPHVLLTSKASLSDENAPRKSDLNYAFNSINNKEESTKACHDQQEYSSAKTLPHHHHLYYSQMSDQISTPTTTTSIGEQQQKATNNEQAFYYDNDNPALGHLVLFNETVAQNTVDDAQSKHFNCANLNDSYALYNLTELTRSATAANFVKEKTIPFSNDANAEEIEMKSLLINSKFYSPQEQLDLLQTKAATSKITGSGTNLVLISHRKLPNPI